MIIHQHMTKEKVKRLRQKTKKECESIMPFSILEHWSPEYALNNVLVDMREYGLEGLKKHLTSNALKTVEGFEKITGRPEVSLLTSSLLGGNAVSILLGKLSDCEWTVKEVMKGDETSKANVGFAYEDSMVVMAGTVELTMIKEDSKWKIDRLGLPKFDKLTLPQAEAPQAGEE